MQSNRESLFSKFRQGVIEFRSHYRWHTGVICFHVESFTDNESKRLCTIAHQTVLYRRRGSADFANTIEIASPF